MTRRISLLIVALLMVSAPAFAQDAGTYYQGGQPIQPQGYETPQADAYRGQANASGYQQPIQPDSSSLARANLLDQQQSTTQSPIKPSKEGGMHIKGAVGRIGRTLSHAALPVAGLGAMYMVTRAASRSGMMGGSPMRGMMGGNMMGGNMMGRSMMGGMPMMNGYGGGYGGYPSTMGGYGYGNSMYGGGYANPSTLMNFMR